MNILKATLTACALSIAGMAATAPTFAQSAIAQTVDYETSGTFVKKSKRLKGGWEVVERDGKTLIVFADDFRAAKGPDLKIFLSPKSVADATGNNAVDGSLNIGELKATKGVQEYEVPAGVDLADYGSVLVHCEKYSVLWGGGDL